MQRILLAACTTLTLLAAACSDGGPARSAAPGERATAPRYSLTQADLDARIKSLIVDLFPNGLETATGARWESVKEKVAQGQTDPAQAATARAKLVELTQWILQKRTSLTAPAGETVSSAVAKLVLYMSAYVYGASVPAVPAGVDAAVGLVLPDGSDPAPIVTESKFAGVDLKAGSVAVPTVITVMSNAAEPTYGTCAGPLNTTLCQVPRFYKFESFPHVKLAVPATFVVCHTKPASLPWATSDLDARLRLAHDKPLDPANYSAGSTIYEGIEILKYVPVTAPFVDCDGSSAPSQTHAAGSVVTRLQALAGAAWSFVAPKTAWAIDLGGGGESSFFSNFNHVDPTLVVQFSNIGMSACNDITFGYTVDGVAKDVYNKPAGCASTTYADAAVRVPVAATVKVYLRDNSCTAADVFTQDGGHGLVTGTNPAQIAITDAGGFCQALSNGGSRPPVNGIGNLNVTRTVTPSPTLSPTSLVPPPTAPPTAVP